MLKRKISETLKKWKEQPDHFPLVIMGIRQCGKTYISQLFAEENYKHVRQSWGQVNGAKHPVAPWLRSGWFGGGRLWIYGLKTVVGTGT